MTSRGPEGSGSVDLTTGCGGQPEASEVQGWVEVQMWAEVQMQAEVWMPGAPRARELEDRGARHRVGGCLGGFQGGANYGKSAKSRKLYSSQLPFVAASQEVEKVTLLLNSFPVKAGASPLSEFEDLGLGLDTPATRRISLALSWNEGQTLTLTEPQDLLVMTLSSH
ncbi:uncharacterized protein EI90DRAFT_3124211 [Cantharellus anzutake]|uniref:uncharacterized protein n=1 Tax=Cantharellus anzutake TaxID=1750568 RepID=UPI0019079E5A|nr:uncharacterized protein EI90DRAFT_3124211 [Cantharellus anzutake]KAF8330557.1 hypothetical protein EI90DRAFT_3124211 [Cantharellus anzutake]